MNYRRWQWRVADRQRFIETLTETGKSAAGSRCDRPVAGGGLSDAGALAAARR